MKYSNESYQDMNQYHEDLITYAKACLSEYLKKEFLIGAEHSINQHFFEDTLLLKETKNFLSQGIEEFDLAGMQEQIAGRAARSMEEGLFLPLEYLCRSFQLNKFEAFIVCLLAAAGLDAGFEKAYAFIHNDWRYNGLSVGLATQLYNGADISRKEMLSLLSEDSKLFRILVSAAHTEDVHPLKRILSLNPVITAFLHGQNLISDEYQGMIVQYHPQEKPDPILIEDKPYLHILQRLSGVNKEHLTLFCLYGAAGIGKKLNIKHLACELSRPVLFLKLEELYAYLRERNIPDGLYTLLRTIVTGTMIKQSLLCISTTSNTLPDNEPLFRLLKDILTYIRQELPVVFLTSDCMDKIKLKSDDTDVIAIKVAAESPEENRRFWMGLAEGYRFDQEVSLESFADKFILTPGQIKEIYEEARTLSEWYGKTSITPEQLQKVCFEKMEHNLGKKAQKVKLNFQWEDLILPDYQKKLLRTAVDQIKYRYKVLTEWGYGEKMPYGTGLSMIFSGAPGTGKTMAAQVLARELGLELYKIELAGVVSKYIGETQRNLNEIFEEARKSQSIIFFDEADVLFSKRSEVKDSNDKYSNMEAAFLLQKIEEYTGIVILATNYQQNIDEAFKRRIKILIDFPFPDREYRNLLWKKAFPDKLPLSADIDYDYLAGHFELSGSNIRNVALNAAFLAASEDTELSMAQIIEAVVNEFAKSGKKLSKEELGEYYMYVK